MEMDGAAPSRGSPSGGAAGGRHLEEHHFAFVSYHARALVAPGPADERKQLGAV